MKTAKLLLPLLLVASTAAAQNLPGSRTPFELPSQWRSPVPGHAAPSVAAPGRTAPPMSGLPQAAAGPTASSVTHPYGWPPRSWVSRRLVDAYQEAVRSNKYLVVLWEQDSCGWCVALREAILREPGVSQFYDRAVFVTIDPMKDEDEKKNVEQLHKHLKVVNFPTLVVLRVTASRLDEVGRIIGYFPGPDFVAKLSQIAR